MKRLLIHLLIITFISSCSLFGKLRKERFSYEDNGQRELIVWMPKKGNTKKQTDAQGNIEMITSYGDAVLYYAHLRDTTKQFIPINDSFHIPLPHPMGGLIYKGTDDAGAHYWREIRLYNGWRFVYKNVPAESESRFDSALNLSSRLIPAR